MKKITFIFILCCLVLVANAQKAKRIDAGEKKNNISHQAISIRNNNGMPASSKSSNNEDFTKSTKEGSATIVLTVEDIWNDGSGYQLLLDADATAYGNEIPGTGQFPTSGDLPSSFYDIFEYKIPTDADGAVNTENVVIENSISITVPAGSYDYVITNPSPNDYPEYNRIWIASDNCDPSRGDGYEFRAGYIYIFSITYDPVEDNDCITIDVIEGGNSPLIYVDEMSSNISFIPMALEGTVETKEIRVQSFNLTDNITLTTVAPFSISTDNVNFATTATLTSDGGMVYVKFEPTEEVEASETITLSSTGAEDITINLSGTAVDCSGAESIPVEQGFEDNSFLCWPAIELSSASMNMLGVYEYNPRNGDYSWMFSSYEENDDDVYDQYLISNELVAGGNELDLRFYYYADTELTEEFKVGYSTTTNELSAFTWFDEVSASYTDTWVLYSESLPAATKYVAIHYYSDYSYDLYIDDITLTTTVDVPTNQVNNVSIYPNPSNGNVNILVSENSTVKLIDVTGRIIETYNVNADSILNISQASGAYFVQVESNGNVETHKLIIR